MIKVLLIDDDFLMIRMYQKIFIFENFEVETAFDGEEGLHKAKTINPTVILLDILMPKMNGFEVLEELKLDPQTKHLPVIMLTNHSDPESIERAFKKGALEYIIKFDNDPKQIATRIKRLIEEN